MMLYCAPRGTGVMDTYVPCPTGGGACCDSMHSCHIPDCNGGASSSSSAGSNSSSSAGFGSCPCFSTAGVQGICPAGTQDRFCMGGYSVCFGNAGYQPADCSVDAGVACLCPNGVLPSCPALSTLQCDAMGVATNCGSHGAMTPACPPSMP